MYLFIYYVREATCADELMFRMLKVYIYTQRCSEKFLTSRYEYPSIVLTSLKMKYNKYYEIEGGRNFPGIEVTKCQLYLYKNFNFQLSNPMY